MYCPNCGQENPEGNSFCIFCGTSLILESREEETPGQEAPSGPTPEAPTYAELQEEVNQLRQLLQAHTTRIFAVERFLGVVPPASAAPPAATPAPIPPAQPRATSPATPAQPPAAAIPPTPSASVPQEPVPTGRDGAPPAQVGGESGGPPLIPRISIDWEQVLGRNWLAIIGAVALAIGMGFFLRLAFENDWIGERGRVILGIATGVALLGIGEYTQRLYPRWAQAVIGGGIGILYLSIYAAFGFYQLIDPLPAFLFLGLVVLLSGLLALRYESLVIALMGIFGAFLTPVLLGRDLEPEQRFLLLVYILVVDAGILGVSTFRNWRWFTLIGLLASYGLFALWLEQIPSSDLVLAQIGLTGIFLIFAGATTLFHVLWRRVPRPQDMSLMTLNALFYFGNTYGLLWDKYEAWFGFITLALSLFYGLVGYGAIKRTGAPPQVALFSLATALVFLTVAVPLQLGGGWITVAWAAEGAVLVWVGFLLRSWPTRAFAVGVFAIAALRLLVFDTPVELEGFQLFLNDRFPTFVAAIAAFYVGAYLYWRERARLKEWEQYIYLALAGAASFFTVWVLSAEIISFFDWRELAANRTGAFQSAQDAENNKLLSLTALWALYAFGLLTVALGRRSAYLRWAGLGLLSLPVLKLLFVDTFAVALNPLTFRLVLNFYFVTFLLVLGVVVFAAYLYWRQREQLISGERYVFLALLIVGNVVALWALSVEAVHFFDSRESIAFQSQAFQAVQDASNGRLLSLTALWAVYAFGLLAIAWRRRLRYARWAGLGLLAVAALKLLFVDTFAVALNPLIFRLVLNIHFLTFLLVLAVVVFAAYLYWRQREDLLEGEKRLYLGLVVAANLIALWGVSAEALRFFDAREVVLQTDFTSAKHLSLTVLWTIYAIGAITVGIVRQSTNVRLAGIALLAVPVVKLFVFDVFLLEQGYRVAAFITLGVLLLGTGLAYQRYSNVIRGFLFGKAS